MSHMIEGSKCFSLKITPWHGLGTVLQNPPTSAEAIVAAGQNWKVEKRPLFWNKNTGEHVEVPNKVALVRDEDEKILSVVSPEYQVLQNSDAFAWFDPIVQAGKAIYETAGVMFGGKKIWVMAKLNRQIIVAGDEYKQYMLLSNGHDGATGVSISPVNTRVVCNNTMRLAMAEGNAQWFNHTGDMSAKLEKAKEVYELSQVYLDEHSKILEVMTTKQLTDQEFDVFLTSILEIEAQVPDESNIVDGETTEPGTKYQLAMKERIKALAEDADGGASNKFKGTAYGAFNSVTQFVDFYTGARSADAGNYQLFGDGQDLKDRAWDYLCAFCNVTEPESELMPEL